MDISTVAACFTVDLDGRNVVRHARLAYGGVAAMPARAQQDRVGTARQSAGARRPVKDVLPILRAEFTPISDVRGSGGISQRALITEFVREVLFDAARPTEVGASPLTLETRIQLAAR